MICHVLGSPALGKCFSGEAEFSLEWVSFEACALKLTYDLGGRFTLMSSPHPCYMFTHCLQAVCDFRSFAAQTLYLWNHKDPRRMKDVPFFCFSHLVMKINVRVSCTGVSWR